MTDLKDKALAAPEAKGYIEPAPEAPHWMNPQSLDDAEKIAAYLAKSDMVPKSYRDNSSKVRIGDLVIAMGMGQQLGLSVFASIQNIASINGVPTVWGDAALALCQASPDYEYVHEWLEPIDGIETAFCAAKKKSAPEPVIRSFSMSDAQEAGLLTKNLWQKYRRRMLQMRARGFALRDTFPGALKGIKLREEVMDYAEPSGYVNPETGEVSGPSQAGTAGLKERLRAQATGKGSAPTTIEGEAEEVTVSPPKKAAPKKKAAKPKPEPKSAGNNGGGEKKPDIVEQYRARVTEVQSLDDLQELRKWAHDQGATQEELDKIRLIHQDVYRKLQAAEA